MDQRSLLTARGEMQTLPLSIDGHWTPIWPVAGLPNHTSVTAQYFDELRPEMVLGTSNGWAIKLNFSNFTHSLDWHSPTAMAAHAAPWVTLMWQHEINEYGQPIGQIKSIISKEGRGSLEQLYFGSRQIGARGGPTAKKYTVNEDLMEIPDSFASQIFPEIDHVIMAGDSWLRLLTPGSTNDSMGMVHVNLTERVLLAERLRAHDEHRLVIATPTGLVLFALPTSLSGDQNTIFRDDLVQWGPGESVLEIFAAPNSTTFAVHTSHALYVGSATEGLVRFNRPDWLIRRLEWDELNQQLLILSPVSLSTIDLRTMELKTVHIQSVTSSESASAAQATQLATPATDPAEEADADPLLFFQDMHLDIAQNKLWLLKSRLLPQPSDRDHLVSTGGANVLHNDGSDDYDDPDEVAMPLVVGRGIIEVRHWPSMELLTSAEFGVPVTHELKLYVLPGSVLNRGVVMTAAGQFLLFGQALRHTPH